MVENGVAEEQDRSVRGGGVQHAIEDRANQQRGERLCASHHGHENYRARQMRSVVARISKQTQQFLHAFTRRRMTAFNTPSTPISAIPSGEAITSAGARHG